MSKLDQQIDAVLSAVAEKFVEAERSTVAVKHELAAAARVAAARFAQIEQRLAAIEAATGTSVPPSKPRVRSGDAVRA